MSDKDILTKAMANAKRNGFDLDDDFFAEIPVEEWLQDGQDLYYSLIFDHNFAKAFWGEEKFYEFQDQGEEVELDLTDDKTHIDILAISLDKIQVPAWQYHLMQMAVRKKPLKYLEKFINDQKLLD